MRRLLSPVAAIVLCSPVLADEPISFHPQPPAPPPPKAEEPVPEFKPVSRDTFVRFRAAAWLTEASGHLQVGDPIPGTTSELDIQDTLGMDTKQTAIMAALGFNFGKDHRWHLDLGYTGHFDYDGTSDPITISFNDRVYTGTITSHTEFDMYEATLSYDLIRAGAFTLALGGGVRAFDFKASVEGLAVPPGGGPAVFTHDEEKAIVPVPAFGMGVRFDLTENLYLRGVARGIYAGKYGSFVDASAELGFDVGPNIGVFGGYRFLRAAADVSNVDFQVTLQGPYAGAEIRF